MDDVMSGKPGLQNGPGKVPSPSSTTAPDRAAGRRVSGGPGKLAIYPLKLEPVLQERVWGGDGLARVLGKHIPPGARIGESWEVSDHPAAVTVVRNGPYSGVGLDQLREQFPEELVGARGFELGRGRLPLLVKFLDCHDRLSVQVHPDDTYAAAHEGGSLGKTEMWYVVSAEPGARIWCGLRPGLDRAALQRAIDEGTVPEMLAEVTAAPGDCFFIPAGRVHALGQGLIVCEVQQNSDVTYRFYDWGRVGLDGKPRELHVRQSLDVVNYADTRSPRCGGAAQAVPGGTVETLVACPQFVAEKLTVTGVLAGDTAGVSFHILSVVAGQGHVRIESSSPEPVRLGESVLIPCAAGAYQIESLGEMVVLRSFVA